MLEVDAKFGLPRHTCSSAIHRPNKRGEEAIAAVLDVSPAELWPDRYAIDGSRLRPQPPENYRPKRRFQGR
jgi:lambda repressor-like predicted transcriptional regulator